MKQLKYVNSQGQAIDFRQFDTQIYQGNFHTYTWTYEGTAQRYGTTIDQFGKDVLEYEMVVAARGGQATKENNLNTITEITEYDVVNNTQGKLWWGDYYLPCNIISATTAPSESFFGAEKTLGVMAPYPFWIQEVTREFYAAGKAPEPSQSEWLDYPYDYGHDYSPPGEGVESWYIDHYATSEFVMTIYGPCENPRILINGYPYEVFDTLEAGEYIVIDSREKTVIKYRSNGTTLNIFDLRAKEQSVFQPIPGGNLSVTWNASFGFGLTLFLERSEPAG